MSGRAKLILGVIAGIFLLGSCALAAGVAFLAFADPDLGPAARSDELRFDTVDEWSGATGFAERWGLVWPDSSRDVRLAEDGFQEPIYHFRLTADVDDLDALINSPGCGGLLTQADSRPPLQIINRELNWWTPEAATSYAQCSGTGEGSRSMVVFLDSTDPQYALIYVAVVLT